MPKTLVVFWRIVPDMRRVPGFHLLLALHRVVAPSLRRLSQLIQLSVHVPDLFPQVTNGLLVLFGEIRVLAFFLRVVLFVVEFFELAPFLVALVLFFKVFRELLLAAEAEAIAVAVAGVHCGTEYLVTCEDVVPDVFENAAGELVVHACREQPLTVVLEALNGHLAYPLPRNGKLRAAYARDGRWDWRAGVYLFPDVPAPVDFLGLVEKVEVPAGAVHVYPVGAAGVVVAAHVHVAVSRHALVVEAVYHLGGVLAHEDVVVPGVAVGVHEQDGVGEVIVVVDDIAEVDLVLPLAVGAQMWWLICAYHSLAAFVLGDFVFGIGVVDLVDDQRGIRDLLRHPADVLLLCLGNHNLEGVVAAWRFNHGIAELGQYAKVQRIAFERRCDDGGGSGIGVPS
jgi:hypothetical protein